MVDWTVVLSSVIVEVLLLSWVIAVMVSMSMLLSGEARKKIKKWDNYLIMDVYRQSFRILITASYSTLHKVQLQDLLYGADCIPTVKILNQILYTNQSNISHHVMKTGLYSRDFI